MKISNNGVSNRGWMKILVGFIAGTVLSGTAAYSFTVNNTPAGGYLLCYNIKTTSVTFPGKLSCPKGTKSLEVAGVNGSNTTIPSNSEATNPTNQVQPNLKCNLAYLQRPDVSISEGVSTCKGDEINKLMNEVQMAIDTAISNTANDSSVNLAIKKELMTILSSIVLDIQKKVKP